MTRTRSFLLAGLVVLLLGGGYLVYYLMNRPMGQTLTLSTPTQAALIEQVSTPTRTPEEEAPAVEAAVPPATPTVTPTEAPKICGNTGSMNLLVIGLTLPTDGEVLAADAIRLVTIDFDQPSASILALPAMLWVDTPVLADLEIEEVPLSAVYAEAYGRVNSASERFRTQVATQALAQTILDNFGFVPDHYITVDEEAFVEYVDLLGGIEVDLPEAVDGTSEGYGYYQAGVQLLDGTRTLNFARLYHPSGMDEFDLWGNQERQNLVVRGILAATLKPQNWTKVPALMNEVLGAVVTDLSLQQTLDLACMAEKVGDSTRMLEVSEEMVSMDESRRLIPDVEAIKELIAQMGSSD